MKCTSSSVVISLLTAEVSTLLIKLVSSHRLSPTNSFLIVPTRDVIRILCTHDLSFEVLHVPECLSHTFVVCEKRILKERSGVIESPGFPESYPPDSKCDFTIEVSKGNKINLTFSHFGLPDSKDCANDYLKVFYNH